MDYAILADRINEQLYKHKEGDTVNVGLTEEELSELFDTAGDLGIDFAFYCWYEEDYIVVGDPADL